MCVGEMVGCVMDQPDVCGRDGRLCDGCSEKCVCGGNSGVELQTLTKEGGGVVP